MNELEILDDIKIENMIYEIRGKQVMLDSDLAKLYKCKNGTKEINQAVKNNVEKFPERFSWILTDKEYENLRSIFLTSSSKNNYGGRRYKPRVFTEQGVAMLATVLKSKTATKVSIAIMDAFVIMRKYISNSLLEQKYINDLVLQNTEDIKLLKQSFSKFEELSNEIYFDGQIYDAYSKIKDILSMAKKELIIIDAYADKVVLDMIKDLSVKVTLIVKNKSLLTKTDINKYNSQYSNLNIIYDDSFYDRYFIIDNDIIYHCGASINHAGSKTFSINKLEDEIVKKSLINKIGDTIYNFKK
ncbi:MAG: ORF6N domain-containing protein [Bacilli bacterium]|nr:ORF6N domain-containing protein [Bacilli bacterium]